MRAALRSASSLKYHYHFVHRTTLPPFFQLHKQRATFSILNIFRRAPRASVAELDKQHQEQLETAGVPAEAQAEALQYPYPAATAWSTNIANPGNPIPDTLILSDTYSSSTNRADQSTSTSTPATTSQHPSDAYPDLGTHTSTTPVSSAPPQETFPAPNERGKGNMASDDDYAAFLERASGGGSASASSKSGSDGKGGFTAKTVDTEEAVPLVLEQVESVFVSEADEEWVPVSLRWGAPSGGVGVDTFAHLISCPASSIQSLSTKDFDPRNHYKDVTDAVKKAGTTGHVEVFRVELQGARCEYWVVSVDEKGKRVVGMKVGAVES